MTNPTHSVFTVIVEFKGTFYDAEITPTWNGKPIEWLPDRVGQWTSAETTHKLFSRKIVEMLNHTNIPADYSLAMHGVIATGSAQGFTFDKGLEVTHTTQEIWEEFIDCLQDPDSYTTGRSPVDEEVVGTGLGTGVALTPNGYLNLSAESQKAVRLSLFMKKCYEHFASVNGVRLADEISEYVPSEKECLTYLLYRNSSLQRLTPGKEAKLIWLMQSEEEKKVMASHVKIIREQMEAAQLNSDVDDSGSELVLDSSEEESSDVELLFSSGEEVDFTVANTIVLNSDNGKRVIIGDDITV